MNRGAAVLPAALAAVAVAAALSAAVAELARLEGVLARSRRTTAEALHAADGCIAETLARVTPGWDLSALLDGPDALPATADDGQVPLPAACTGRARRPPGAPVPPRAVVQIEARAGRGRRALEALVGLEAAPGVPALVWLGAPPTTGAITGSVALDGADDATPPEDWASFAAPDDPDRLDAWLAGEGRVSASARTAPPIFAFAPPLAALGTRVRAAGPAGAEVLVPAAPAVALAHVAGDLAVTDTRSGAGLLFVDGSLDIQGTMDFTGVVVVSGGVHIAAGASLTVSGLLWVGVPTLLAPSLLVDGTLDVRRDRSAVDAADRLLALPRAAALLGLRDLG